MDLPRRSPRFAKSPEEERKSARVMRVEPPKKKRKSADVSLPPEKKARSAKALQRQLTLAQRLNLPVVDGTRSLLMFPVIVVHFLQVKDMAQMTRVNKQWHALCDTEIKVLSSVSAGT